MQLVLSIIAIIVAAAFPLYFSLRKDTASPPAALSIAVVVAAILEFFDLMMMCNPEQLYHWKKFSLTTEATLLPVWLWFALTYSRQKRQGAISIPFRLLLGASPLLILFTLTLPIGSFFYSPDFAVEKILFLTHYGLIFYLLLLTYLVAALIQLELTFIDATQPSRWKIKFEILGAGAFLTVLLVYYSEALIFRTINMQLVPSRSLLLIIAVAMMTYSRLKRGSDVKVYVSQQTACKSTVLLAVGIYIIGFGLAGEGIKYFGIGFPKAIILTVVFLAGFGLLVILLSETVKRRVTVFIHKYFHHNKYDYRTQWIQFTDRLSSSQTSADLLRSIVSEFCDTFGMGTGALFILNQERDRFKLMIGESPNTDDVSFAINDPAIESLVCSKSIVDLREDVAINEHYLNYDFFRKKDACFIIPFFMNEGLDGFIILGMPHNTNEIYGCEDFDLMRTLAKQVSSALMNLRLSDQLACSRELAAIGKVSAFVMHDLKNLALTVSLLLENAQEHITVPAFQNDLLMSLGNTVIKMRTIISRLRHLPEKSSLQLAPVDLLQMVRETAALVTLSSVDVTGEHIIAKADREELQKVALNLMLNAVEATQGSTPVTVEVGEKEDPFIRIKDEGCGIPAAFIQNVLFKPFTSTKTHGMGIGLYQSKQIIEAHGGRIEVVSDINHGSEFTVWLPKMQAEPI